MKLLLSFILLAGMAWATDVQSTVQYPEDISPANISPTFDNGYLVAYGLWPGVAVYRRDGSPAFRYVPPAKALVYNVAVDTDGWAAAALELHDAQVPQRGGIAILDGTGTQTVLIQTEEYVPYGVAFAPDHSVWAIGGRMLRSETVRPGLRNATALFTGGPGVGPLLEALYFRSNSVPGVNCRHLAAEDCWRPRRRLFARPRAAALSVGRDNTRRQGSRKMARGLGRLPRGADGR